MENNYLDEKIKRLEGMIITIKNEIEDMSTYVFSLSSQNEKIYTEVKDISSALGNMNSTISEIYDAVK